MLIVRDEEHTIADCLAALSGVVDEVVVYDTGSTDRTPQLARAAGALLVEGFWDGDFGRARTAAASASRGQWLLVVDADERVVADGDALRARLAAESRPGSTVEAFSVLIDNLPAVDRDEVGYAHWGTRLVRGGRGVRWSGPVHEVPVTPSGAEPASRTMPGHVLRLEHHGYADPAAVRRKGERNAALAQAELEALSTAGESRAQVVAPVLLALGRSLIGAGRPQDAVDAFQFLRELAPGTPEWAEATDHLARLLLGASGHDEVVVLLSDQLREAGADRRYCDWLRAQALAQLGHPAEALRLVRGVDELIDPGGRRYDLGQVLEVRALLAALLGEQDEAVAALTWAMVRHGRVRGRGPMLLELWAGAAPAGLASIVRQAGTVHLAAVTDELRAAGGDGPAVAAALAVLT